MAGAAVPAIRREMERRVIIWSHPARCSRVPGGDVQRDPEPVERVHQGDLHDQRPEFLVGQDVAGPDLVAWRESLRAVTIGALAATVSATTPRELLDRTRAWLSA